MTTWFRTPLTMDMILSYYAILINKMNQITNVTTCKGLKTLG